jgi:hypothetical protein
MPVTVLYLFYNTCSRTLQYASYRYRLIYGTVRVPLMLEITGTGTNFVVFHSGISYYEHCMDRSGQVGSAERGKIL